MINLLFLLLFIFSCSSQHNINSEKDDYILINLITESTKEIGKDFSFEKNRSNTNLINLVNCIKQQKKDCGYFEIDIDNDKVLTEIFSKDEYDFLLSQKSDSEWDKSKIKFISKEENSKRVFFSKPIYSSNNQHAIMEFDWGTRAGIQLFIKENGTWKVDKIIAPIFKQLKIKAQ